MTPSHRSLPVSCFISPQCCQGFFSNDLKVALVSQRTMGGPVNEEYRINSPGAPSIKTEPQWATKPQCLGLRSSPRNKKSNQSTAWTSRCAEVSPQKWMLINWGHSWMIMEGGGNLSLFLNSRHKGHIECIETQPHISQHIYISGFQHQWPIWIVSWLNASKNPVVLTSWIEFSVLFSDIKAVSKRLPGERWIDTYLLTGTPTMWLVELLCSPMFNFEGLFPLHRS